MAELILALDLPDRKRALTLLDTLSDALSWVKVGMELFTREGPLLIKELQARSLKIFLDLKFYDIPHTVGRAVAKAQELGVDLLTLHCQGGQRMLEEAVSQRNLGGTHPLLFGVTVLTSFAEGELPGISLPIKDFAKHLAALASSCRLDGIVTSPMEAAGIKANFPTLKCLCPGIRPSFAQRFDQRRVATPAEAVAAGADYLVIGRPILEAENPKEALLTIREEMI